MYNLQLKTKQLEEERTRFKAEELLEKMRSDIELFEEYPLPKLTQSKSINTIFLRFWDEYVAHGLFFGNLTCFQMTYIKKNNKARFHMKFPNNVVILREELLDESYISSEADAILDFKQTQSDLTEYEKKFFFDDEKLIQTYLSLWEQLLSLLMERYLEYVENIFGKQKKTIAVLTDNLKFPVSIANINIKRNILYIKQFEKGLEDNKPQPVIISHEDFSEILKLREIYYHFTQRINTFEKINTTPFEDFNRHRLVQSICREDYISFIKFEFNHLNFTIEFNGKEECRLYIHSIDYQTEHNSIIIPLDVSEDILMSHLFEMIEGVELYFMVNKPIQHLNLVLSKFSSLDSLVYKSFWQQYAIKIFNALENKLPFDSIFSLMGFLKDVSENRYDEKDDEFFLRVKMIKKNERVQILGKRTYNEKEKNFHMLCLRYQEINLSFVIIEYEKEITEFQYFEEDDAFGQQYQFVMGCLCQ